MTARKQTRRAAAAIVAGVLAASTVTSAFAIEPAKHTVAWYRSNPQARAKVLATCQNDHSFDDSGDCRNAQSASHAAEADSLPTDGSGDPEANPSYYGRDGGMIALTLVECSHHRAPVSWCAAAQTASDNLHK